MITDNTINITCKITIIPNNGDTKRYHLSIEMFISAQFNAQAVGKNISEKPSPNI